MRSASHAGATGMPEATPSSRPTEQMECRSRQTCPSHGIRREVPLQVVVPGVLARPNYICADCGMELMTITRWEG